MLDRKLLSAAGRPLAMIAAVLAMAVLALGACRGNAGEGSRGTAAGPGGKVGARIEDLRLVGLDGVELTSASLQGKVVVVDFWDTWCGPCLRALPHLKELAAEHGDDVVVVAVAIGREGEGKVREVSGRLGLDFPVALLGEQGDLSATFGEIEALPTTFLLDGQGVIRERWVGAQSPATYERSVAGLLGS